jgi:hypothetical protein
MSYWKTPVPNDGNASEKVGGTLPAGNVVAALGSTLLFFCA